MSSVTRSPSLDAKASRLARTALTTALIGSLAACSSTDNLLGLGSDNKVDYRSAARQTSGLDVPPDLTQLARDNRAQVQGGVISASALQQAGTAARSPSATPGKTVALNSAGDVRLERSGDTRWVHSAATPEQLWPQLRGF